jgi:hypothetical protein
LERDVLTLALHEVNGESAGNYHLMDEDSARRMGFRSSYKLMMRNPPEKVDPTGNGIFGPVGEIVADYRLLSH